MHQSDSTEFRIWSRAHRVSADEIFVRRAELYGVDSASLKISPRFCRMQSKRCDGVVTCLDLEALDSAPFAGDGTVLRTLMSCVDNQGADREALRRVSHLPRRYPNILIGVVICFGRCLANGAKCGSNFHPMGYSKNVAFFEM